MLGLVQELKHGQEEVKEEIILRHLRMAIHFALRKYGNYDPEEMVDLAISTVVIAVNNASDHLNSDNITYYIMQEVRDKLRKYHKSGLFGPGFLHQYRKGVVMVRHDISKHSEFLIDTREDFDLSQMIDFRETLTKRENHVLDLIMSGKDTYEIMSELQLSEGRISQIKKEIRRKYDELFDTE